MKKENIIGISAIVRQLNCDQARAVLKSLMSNDYAIIEGFPGTGKKSVFFNEIINFGKINENKIKTMGEKVSADDRRD